MRTTRALAIAGISFARVYPQPRADSDHPAPSHSRLQRDVPLPFRNSTSLDIEVLDQSTSEGENIVTSTVGVSIGAITTHSFVGHTEGLFHLWQHTSLAQRSSIHRNLEQSLIHDQSHCRLPWSQQLRQNMLQQVLLETWQGQRCRPSFRVY